jgi:hypothetical protein
MLPENIFCTPAIALRRLDFPVPFIPMIDTTSHGDTQKHISLRIYVFHPS